MSNQFRQMAMQKITEASQNSNGGSGGTIPEGWPSRFYYGPDEQNYITFLHDYSLNIPLQVHVIDISRDAKNKRFLTRICDSMYKDTCDDCDSTSDKVGKRTALFVFLGYVHTLEGKTREIQSGKRKGEEVDEEPFRVVEVRAGKKQANISELMEADRGGYFRKMIWQIKKTGTGTDTTYLPPMPVPIEKLGAQFISTIPEYVNEALTPPKGLTLDQLVSAMILAPYGNNEQALSLLGVPPLEEVVELLAKKDEKKTSKPSDKLR